VADEAFLRQFAATYRFRLGSPRSIALTPDGSAVLFLRSGPRSFVHDLYVFDPSTGKERRLFDAAQILGGQREQLTTEERARRERQRLMTRGITWFRMSHDGMRLLVSLSGRLFLVQWKAAQTTELQIPPGSPPIDPRLSPDGTRVAYVRDGDLHLFEVQSQKERRLTRHEPNVVNGLAEFVAQEEMGRQRGFWWSPNSARLAYQQTDTSAVKRLHILDPARPDQAPQQWPYPRAGQPNARVRLGVVSAAGGPTRWLAWDHDRFPYLTTVKWPEKGPLLLVVQSRRQDEMALLVGDPVHGQTRALLSERDAAWLNIDQQMPRWLPDGSGFLWTTERQGAWQLEMRAPDGKLLRALTPAKPGYRGLLDVDPAAGTLLVKASVDSPREVHLLSLPLAGGAPASERSKEHGWHDAVFAREHQVYVHTLEPLSGRPRFTVHRKDGSRAGQLRTVVEDPPFAANLELLQIGPRRFEAAVVRPRNFRRGRRYPVVVYAYGGPGYQVVTARWHRYLIQQWIADHGFVVVSIDGRGTPGRGREWERSGYLLPRSRSFIEVPLADQAEALRALGRRFDELDLSRVGVLGWSFGGYFATMAVLRQPDLFRAAVAGAPVTEWLDYDTHYTERYLGLPDENRQGYRSSSALLLAPSLRRPLLVIHGTADDNVYFSHSVRLSDTLFRAGRRHDFLPLTNFTHLVPDPLVTRRLYRRIVDFFRRHLQRSG